VFHHILLATDLTEASDPAQEMAATLAEKFGARVTVLHVCEPPAMASGGAALANADLVGPCGDGAQADLARLVSRLRGRSISADGIQCLGVPWQQIVDVTRRLDVDLVVTGTHSRRGLAHVVYGSVAERIVQESPVPVLAVPHAPAG
jgi:nucleotide-binding universal stress UspA family protein